MLEALSARAWVRSEHLELALVGVPGVERAAVFCWPEPLGRPRRVLVDVVRLDQAVLNTPVQLAFELFPEERPVVPDETPPVVVEAEDGDEVSSDQPLVVTVPGPEGPVTWRRTRRAAYEKEVQRLDDTGSAVLGLVDTGTYCYRMTCACGRVRYARPNSLHQIFWCRVCTRTIRLRRRALSQYRARYGRPR